MWTVRQLIAACLLAATLVSGQLLYFFRSVFIWFVSKWSDPRMKGSSLAPPSKVLIEWPSCALVRLSLSLSLSLLCRRWCHSFSFLFFGSLLFVSVFSRLISIYLAQIVAVKVGRRSQTKKNRLVSYPRPFLLTRARCFACANAPFLGRASITRMLLRWHFAMDTRDRPRVARPAGAQVLRDQLVRGTRGPAVVPAPDALRPVLQVRQRHADARDLRERPALRQRRGCRAQPLQLPLGRPVLRPRLWAYVYRFFKYWVQSNFSYKTHLPEDADEKWFLESFQQTCSKPAAACYLVPSGNLSTNSKPEILEELQEECHDARIF